MGVKGEITFWGTRGSIPTPGRLTLKFGGNTSCVEIRFGRASLILDGGTGIRVLGRKRRSGWQSPISILTSHTHQDHIAGIPFFGPALVNGQSIRIYGPPGIKRALRHLFPFPELLSRREIVEIRAQRLFIVPFQVSSQWLNHPGPSLGYRVILPTGKRVVYLSDHEPTLLFRHSKRAPSDRELIRWMGHPDLLIMDAQYFDREYPRRQGWGHSPISATLAFAVRAGAKRLVLFHHDPSHSDSELMRQLKRARLWIRKKGSPLRLFLAQEGKTLRL